LKGFYTTTQQKMTGAQQTIFQDIPFQVRASSIAVSIEQLANFYSNDSSAVYSPSINYKFKTDNVFLRLQKVFHP